MLSTAITFKPQLLTVGGGGLPPFILMAGQLGEAGGDAALM